MSKCPGLSQKLHVLLLLLDDEFREPLGGGFLLLLLVYRLDIGFVEMDHCCFVVLCLDRIGLF